MIIELMRKQLDILKINIRRETENVKDFERGLEVSSDRLEQHKTEVAEIERLITKLQKGDL